MNSIILDQNAQQRARDAYPHEAAAAVAVDRNKWFLVVLVQSLLLLILLMMVFWLFKAAQGHTEVLYIKLYADGRAEVVPEAPSSVQDFYKANIDSQLTNYVRYRWDKRGATIREDYGRALLFMGEELTGTFTNPQGYYAADKAAKLSVAVDADSEKYHVDFIDHYDKKTAFKRGGRAKGELYRTNLYLTRTIVGAHGEVKGKPEKYVLGLDWRLMDKDEFTKLTKEFFIVNPMAIKIEEEVMNLSPTETPPAAAATPSQ